MVCKLIDICKKRFSDKIVITEEEEKAFKVMALIHDIGHGCFSHVSERYLKGTHEERTVNLLEDDASEIHNVLINPPVWTSSTRKSYRVNSDEKENMQ